MSWLSDEEEALCRLLDPYGPILRSILAELRAVSHRQEHCCQELNKKLEAQGERLTVLEQKVDQILHLLTQGPGKMELKFGTPTP